LSQEQALECASKRKRGRLFTIPDHLEAIVAERIYDAAILSKIPITLNWVRIEVLHVIALLEGRKPILMCTSSHFTLPFCGESKRYPNIKHQERKGAMSYTEL
jgi:hypothetical protein